MSKEKIVTLITGAERGIGFETAKQLGQKGQQIIIGAYDMALGQQAVKDLSALGIEADLVHCDITDQSTVDAAVKTIADKYGYLNILINNAGISGDVGLAPSAATDEQIMKTFNTNFFGTVRMTRAALPLIKKASFGKIISVASDLGSLELATHDDSYVSKIIDFPYQASKTAVNAMTVSYAKELRGTNITANSVNPGMTATDLINKEAFEKQGAQSVAVGAKRIIELASDPENTVTGTFTENAGIVPW